MHRNGRRGRLARASATESRQATASRGERRGRRAPEREQSRDVRRGKRASDVTARSAAYPGFGGRLNKVILDSRHTVCLSSSPHPPHRNRLFASGEHFRDVVGTRRSPLSAVRDVFAHLEPKHETETGSRNALSARWTTMSPTPVSGFVANLRFLLTLR